MFRKILFFLFLCIALAGCQKKPVATPERSSATEGTPIREDPVHKLAREAAEKIAAILQENTAAVIEINISNHDILPAKAFDYFQNALTAQLASHRITIGAGEWKLIGDLSKQLEQLRLGFTLWNKDQQISSGSASVPDDDELKNTLAQFQGQTAPAHDHSGHAETAIPAPLAQLNAIPLDVAENCKSSEGCSVLLLYSQELVERNWQTGEQHSVPLPVTSIRSRAPSGKILILQDTIFILTNQLSSPVVLNRDLQPAKAELPATLPKPEAGLNTYALADGKFYDFEQFASSGLAVVNSKNHLQLAEQGMVISNDQLVGGTLAVLLPYIYVSSPKLQREMQDAFLKFRYDNGQLLFEGSQNVEGNIFDIAITDLNQDQKKEMLLTVQNPRGIFIEAHDL
jgi:hypothetical protein